MQILWKIRMAAILCLTAGLSGAALAKTDSRPVITTEEGAVRGNEQAGVRQYLGIPYAAPPTGEARWQLPGAPPHRSGILETRQYRDACPQVERFHITEASDAEDCLYLNIAVPTPPTPDHRLRPVLFWIHGGAYVGGGANLYRLDHLARRGNLVVVSINYRLGVLGFLSHPALDSPATGAFGIADQQAALRWVNRNIARFGGDPSRVIIAGESAGAGSVCALLAAPEQVGGLYAGAIVQSAGCSLNWSTTDQAQDSGQAFAAAVGCTDEATVAQCLRSVPIARLLEVQTNLPTSGLVKWSPSVGSSVLPRQPLAAARDGLVRVPVINGGTRDEMRLYVGYEIAGRHPYSATEYAARIDAYYPGHGAQVLQRYPASDYSSPSTALGTALSDFGPGIPLANCAYLHFADVLAQHTTVYQYEFSDRGAPEVMDNPGMELGAVHSSELPYFFPGFSNHSSWEGPPLQGPSAQLSDDLIDAWSAFAYGRLEEWPRGGGWPRYTGGATVRRFDAANSAIFDASAAHQCPFWRGLYPDSL